MCCNHIMINIFKKPKQPTLMEQVEYELSDAEFALLKAEAELERANGNVQLFRLRVQRLRARLADVDLADSHL